MSHPDSAPGHEKDEEAADPDYIVADKTPVDKEELRDVNVSKKELNDLLNELYKSLTDVDLGETDLLLDDPFQFTANDAYRNAFPATLSAPTKATSSITTTLCKLDAAEMAAKKVIDKPISSSESASDPICAANPAFEGHSAGNGNLESEQAQQVVPPVPEIAAAMNALPFTANVSPIACNYPIAPPPQQPITPMPKEAILIPVIINTPPTPTRELQCPPYFLVMPPLPTMSLFVPPPSQPTQTPEAFVAIAKGRARRVKRAKFKKNRYSELENIDPNETASNPQFPSEFGFTSFQRYLLDQQLKMHVQLSAQSFMQTYGHPKFYPYANRFQKFTVIQWRMSKSHHSFIFSSCRMRSVRSML